MRSINPVNAALMSNAVPVAEMKLSAMCPLAATLNDKPVPAMAPGNTCYSWVNDREAIAVVNSYRIDAGKVVQIEQKLTPGQSVLYGQHALGWATSIWNDILG